MTVITVNSLSVIYHANVSIKNTSRNTYDISLPCASVYCQTATKDRFNSARELYISIGTSFLSCHIFLCLYWQSLPPIVLSIHSKELTPTIISLENLNILISDVKSQFSFLQFSENDCLGKDCQIEQVLWGSFCLNYPDLLFFRQFIENTPISQFWSIYKPSLLLLNPSPTVAFSWYFFNLAVGYLDFKEMT